MTKNMKEKLGPVALNPYLNDFLFKSANFIHASLISSIFLATVRDNKCLQFKGVLLQSILCDMYITCRVGQDQNGSLPIETGYKRAFRATNMILTDLPCVFLSHQKYHDFLINRENLLTDM